MSQGPYGHGPGPCPMGGKPPQKTHPGKKNMSQSRQFAFSAFWVPMCPVPAIDSIHLCTLHGIIIKGGVTNRQTDSGHYPPPPPGWDHLVQSSGTPFGPTKKQRQDSTPQNMYNMLNTSRNFDLAENNKMPTTVLHATRNS